MVVTKIELARCKRAVVVLAEVRKVIDQTAGVTKAPLELREDLKTLMTVLRRLDAIATD